MPTSNLAVIPNPSGAPGAPAAASPVASHLGSAAAPQDPQTPQTPQTPPHHSAPIPSLIPSPASSPAAPADDPDPRDRHLTEEGTRLRRVLRTGLQAEYTWESLPVTHVEMLHTLAEQPGISVSDAAVELRLTISDVSSLIRQMAADGLVEQSPADGDRQSSRRSDQQGDQRTGLVRLTQAGADQLAGWQAAHRERIAAALSKLATDEQFDAGQEPFALDQTVDDLTQ